MLLKRKTSLRCDEHYSADVTSTNCESINPPGVIASLHFVVIGAGPVGVRFVNCLLKNLPTARITLFGNEPYAPYNRVQLTSVLAREVRREQVNLAMPGKGEFPNFSYRTATVTRIDRQLKVVHDSLDESFFYDKLILATGARPHLPSIPGANMAGVYTFRNLKDTDSLYARIASSKHIVVVGGGVLGLEAANALLQSNTRVTVIQQSQLLMNRQLDARASALFLDFVESKGIAVKLGQGVREVMGDSRVAGVQTRDGELIACDTVLFCTGIIPNTGLALDAGLAFNIGIKVDDRLQTNDASVYAIGECCEHKGITYGLVSPGFEQADVLADRLAGGQAQYRGSLTVAKLKCVGQSIASVGDVNDEQQGVRVKALTYFDSKQSMYRKLVLRRGRLAGILAYGDNQELPRLLEAFNSQRRIPVWQQLSFRLTGNLWPGSQTQDVRQWPATAVVCQCNALNVGKLLSAIDQGTDNIEALGRATGAGTVCGSCKPLLAQLTGDSAKPGPLWGWRTLLITSIFAMLTALVILATPGWTVADSVQQLRFPETIWNDKFYKQVTGFTVLGLSSLGLLLSVRKRSSRFSAGKFEIWRLAHSVLGLFATGMLVFHTGLHLGEGINRLLIVNFLLVAVLGALTGSVIALSHRMSLAGGKRARDCWYWLHTIVSWPLPALVVTHIISVYYF